jgi:hypothetical protein
MGVRESLVLDHFYISVPSAEFDPLIELTKLFKDTSHGKSQVQDDEWEGIYAYSRTRSYFEILRERRGGGFGLCFSPYSSLYVDASKIMEEMKEEPWRSGTRVWQTGLKWYDWISTGDYLDIDKTFFNAWIMKYHPHHFDWKHPIPVPGIDKYSLIRLTLGRDNVDEVKRLSSWFPGTRTFNEKKIRFEMQDRDELPFAIEISLLDGNQRFEFVSLEMKHCDPLALPDGFRKELGSFMLEVKGHDVLFARKNPEV